MSEPKVFKASAESKAKAKQFRLFALLAWFIAIAGEVFAILKLIKDETMVWLIVAIVVILILSIVGSVLWKKANRLDPASEKNKFKFFVQNQLGAILAVLAFLPLVIFIFASKNTSKSTKGITGAIAVVALLAATIVGIDFNPPSIEKYSKEIQAQTDSLKQINHGVDHVYWTRGGSKYHIFKDCQHIKNRDILEGTVKDAWESNPNIKDNDLSELCKTCKNRAERENAKEAEQVIEAVK
ncbi:MAG: hypothetical protein GX259_11665 [Bacteroidales bacterium]|nr:hypothetical protein [Bacteroidales bacterium]